MGSSAMVMNRAEQSRAEQSRAEQSRAEQMAHPHVRVVLRRIQPYTDPSLVAHTTTTSFVRTEKNGMVEERSMVKSQNDADCGGAL
jgi:hypothetical protein